MKKIILFLFTLNGVFLNFAQNNTAITYDFTCFEEDETSSFIGFFGDIEQSILNNSGENVSISDEKNFGKEFHIECQKNFQFIEKGKEVEKLQFLLNLLVKNIHEPKGFEYSIYLIDTTMLNAFTVGGRIYMTTEMFNFCKNDDELVCIIGHEIAHNELGHISDNLKRIKSAESLLGKQIGTISAHLGMLIITPFNQKKEIHCDMIGIDLAKKSGFNACAEISLWTRMSKSESEYNQLNSIFSSHPYSLKRKACAENHLNTNYKINCKQ